MGALAQQGADVDPDALFRRIAALELFSQSTIASRILRLAATAAVSNPIINPPLTLPAAWAPTTVYTLGTVVTNDSGKQYICYTAGTSAGSGGPTGTGAAAITDNTCAWHYYGASRISANSPAAPAFSVTTGSTPAGLTTLYSPLVNPGSMLLTGGTPKAAQGGYSALAAFPSTQIGSTSGNCGYNDGTWNFGWSATSYVDDAKFAYGTSNNTTPVRVIIDGQYFYDGGDSNNSGNPVWRVLDFTSNGGRRPRLVTVEGPGNTYFAGFRVSPQGSVWAPGIDVVKVAVLGSSIEAGANGYPILSANLWEHQVGKHLGWADVRALGIGGSGYLQPGSPNGTNYAGHLSDATNFAPDVVIVGGPINDTTNGYTQVQIQVAALSLFQQIRAALPSAIIIAGGNYPGSTGPSAANLAGEAGVLAAVNAFADARAFFVPIANDSNGAWISGTGKVTATTGTGNADVYISSDGTHLVEFGNAYYARRWAAAIRQNVLPALK